MKHKIKKTRPILFKILLPVSVLIVFEILLLVSTIFGGGVTKYLDENAKDILHEKVLNRKNYIENEMVHRWSNLSLTATKINQETQNLIDSNDINLNDLDDSSENCSLLLSNVSKTLIDLMRNNSVTGVFLIMNTEKLPNNISDNSSANAKIPKKPGLYIRDLDPKSKPSERNFDLLLEFGPISVFQSLGISTDVEWNPMFDFDEIENSSFFTEPFNAAYSNNQKKTSFTDFGYWSDSFRINANDRDVISYSVPLILDDGTVYGVLGIDLTVDYLCKLLPSDEIKSDNSSSYIMAHSTDEFLNFENVIISGPAFQNELNNEKTIELTEIGENYYKIEKPTLNDSFSCSLEYLNIYNSNTPFSYQKWAIIGAVSENNLFAFSRQITATLITAILITFLVGIVGSILVSFLISNPISELIKEMKKTNSSDPINLKRTGILEIDRLVSSVEKLSYNVINSAAKFSQIMEMASVKIAGFEMNRNDGSLFITDHFFEMFGNEEIDVKSLTIDKFDSILNEFSIYLCENSNKKDDVLYKIPSGNNFIFLRLNLRDNEQKQIGLLEDVTSAMHEIEIVEHERDHDLLTSLINRRAFQNIMLKLFEQKDSLKKAALIMIDLDKLKPLNDTYGHDCGDKYIKSAARCFLESSPENAVITRISGDEFYIFIYGYEDYDEIYKQIDILREGIESWSIILPDNQIYPLKVSGGIAKFPEDTDSYDLLLKYSDFAMYSVKNSGRGALTYFNHDEYLKEAFLLKNKDELTEIIKDKKIFYHFQPIVDAKTGEIFAYEALMRSDMPTLNNPEKILSLAKLESKLNHIEVLTWFKALESYIYYVENGTIPYDCKIFVNSISSQVMPPDDMKKFENEFKDYLFNIVLEVTEDEKIGETAHRYKIDRLNKWNGAVALDDYGSGYNSEKVLLSLCPDYIKIDLSIIRDVNKNTDKQKVVQNIVSYAHERGMKIIAEGIENGDELKTSVELGVDLLQGYFLSKPMRIPPQISEESYKLLKTL